MRFKGVTIYPTNTNTLQILLAISVFTHYAHVIPLGTNISDENAKAIENLLEQRLYRQISTDRGSEIVNSHVEKVLLKYNIMLYHNHSPIKAALAERLIKTIRISFQDIAH